MHWIEAYQLFLFDFDGLLADTERLHYRAYLDVCAARGFRLDWDFTRFSKAAHYRSSGLRDQIYSDLPDLYAQEPEWAVLYGEKQQRLMELAHRETVPLMPGAAPLLLALEERGIERCVVTHSPASLTQAIKKQNPALESIPHWITREDYAEPKPHPACYQLAVSRLARPEGRVIGFEDSPRGLCALLGTRAKPILICPEESPYLQDTLKAHPAVPYYPSFTSLLDSGPQLKIIPGAVPHGLPCGDPGQQKSSGYPPE